METAPASPSPLTSRLMVLMFTDLANSTALKTRIGAAAYSEMIRRHDQLFRQALDGAPSGRVLQDTGDGYFVRFDSPSDAVRAALRFQYLMKAEPWPEPFVSRVGIHLGEVAEFANAATGQNRFVGLAADLASRVMSLAVGGQILLTRIAFDEARQFVNRHPPVGDTPDDEAARPDLQLNWIAHGPYLFKGADEPMDVYEVGAIGIAPLAPPADSEKARRHIRPGDEATLGWRPATGLTLPNAPHWVIEQKLGEGGFGEVWLARHAKTRAARVFKFCFDADRLRALKREFALFRLLKEALGERRDIARVIDFQFAQPPYFIEMDHSPQGNLTDWAARQGGIDKVPLKQRVAIVAQVADALAAAHSVGVLHKDIKPSNILIVIDEAGHAYPRLTDFGIGILTDRGRLIQFNITPAGFTASNLTDNDSSRTGTRMYAPPEALSGRPHTVQGDVYALGVLLYQMVIGDLTRPLAAGWERHVADEMLREDIAACVEGDPAHRLPGATELARRLKELPARRAQRAAQRQAESLLRRRKRLLRLAGLAAVLMLVLAVGALVAARRERGWRLEADGQRDRARDERDRADRLRREIQVQAAYRGIGDADTLAALGDWERARSRYAGARDDLRTLGLPQSAAYYKLCEATARAGIAVTRFVPPAADAGSPPVVVATACSPDARIAVTGHLDGSARVWDAIDGRLLHVLDNPRVPVPQHAIDSGTFAARAVAVSADASTVLVCRNDLLVTLWDARTGTRLRPLVGHGDAVFAGAMTPDARTAVTGGWGGETRCWDLASGQQRWGRRDTQRLRIDAVAMAPGGEFAVSGDPHGHVQLHDAMTGAVVHEFTRTSRAGITCLAVSPDSRLIASGDNGGGVAIHDVAARTDRHLLAAHAGHVAALAFAPDGATLITTATDRTIKLWDVASGSPLGSCGGRTAQAQAIAANGRFALAATPAVPDASAAAAAPAPDTAVAAPDTAAAELLPIDLAAADTPLEPPVVANGAARVIAVAPAGDLVFVGGHNGSGTLCDAATGRRLLDLTRDEPGCTVSDARFTPDGRTLRFATERHVYWVDCQTGERREAAVPDNFAFRAFHPTADQYLARRIDVEELALIDAATGARLRTYPNSGEAYPLIVAPDGRRFITCATNATFFFKQRTGERPTAGLWDMATPTRLRTVPLPASIASGSWDPAGRTVALATGSGPVLRWIPDDADRLTRGTGHGTLVGGACFAPDGSVAATAGNDGRIRIWDTATWSEIGTFASANNPTYAVAFSNEHALLAFGGEPAVATYDPRLGLARLRDLRQPDRLAAVETRVNAARTKLARDPQDAAALATLGQWLAERHGDTWAVEVLARARTAGAAIPPLDLARCYWRLDRYDDAAREFRRAIDENRQADSAPYLQLCLRAVTGRK